MVSSPKRSSLPNILISCNIGSSASIARPLAIVSSVAKAAAVAVEGEQRSEVRLCMHHRRRCRQPSLAVVGVSSPTLFVYALLLFLIRDLS